MAGTDIAIDLGSANFRLYVDGKGVVVDEPNVIAVDEDSNRVVAVGRRAYKMLGRTSDRVRVVKPVTGGVISDLTLMDATLQHYLKKVTNSRVFMPRAVVAVPSGITEVERRAVVDAVAANGIRKVCLIEAPVAAAIGAGLDISRPHGSMVVTLGEGVSDIGVLSMNRLSVSGSIAVGGAVFNEDIIKYARRKFDLIIGEQAAECAVGCAFPLKDIEKYELRGRDERNGLPAKVEVTSDEIGEAMLESVVKVVHKIQSVLEETPPELTADIGNAGIVLTGGGAKLRGLDTLISKHENARAHCGRAGGLRDSRRRTRSAVDRQREDGRGQGKRQCAADRVLLRSGVWKNGCRKAAKCGRCRSTKTAVCIFRKRPWRLSG